MPRQQHPLKYRVKVRVETAKNIKKVLEAFPTGHALTAKEDKTLLGLRFALEDFLHDLDLRTFHYQEDLDKNPRKTV